MSKSKIIQHVADTMGISVPDAREAVNLTLEAIAQGAKENDKFVIKGWGKFFKYTRKARIWHNPHTREHVQIPERTGIKFKRVF